MPPGRPKNSGSLFFCKACKFTTPAKTSHLKSVAHRANKRIRAWLKKPCISFSEIGRRLGLTRERVRQIAEKFCQETGRERQQACAINRLSLQLSSNCLAMKAENLCRKRGLQFQLTEREGHGHQLSTRSVIIENQKSVLRRCSVRKNRNIVIHKPALNAKDAEFMLSYMPDGRWLVVPRSKWPRGASTEFQPAPLEKPGAKGRRHDWRAFIDAWHLLKNVVET
jgi:hypothetical protein